MITAPIVDRRKKSAESWAATKRPMVAYRFTTKSRSYVDSYANDTIDPAPHNPRVNITFFIVNSLLVGKYQDDHGAFSYCDGGSYLITCNIICLIKAAAVALLMYRSRNCVGWVVVADGGRNTRWPCAVALTAVTPPQLFRSLCIV